MESSTTRATVGIGSGGRYPHAPGSDSSRAILDGTSRNRPQRLLGSHPQRKKRPQSSLSWVPSSIFRSLNSLDSKISPHSLHSTNSDSSSRLTICTRGCLQGCFMSRLWAGGVDFEVINPKRFERNQIGGSFRWNFRYFRPAWRVVKSPGASLWPETIPDSSRPLNYDQNHRLIISHSVLDTYR